jgi:hypothetical protein
MADELDEVLQATRAELARLEAELALRKDSDLQKAKRALEAENLELQKQLAELRAKLAKLTAAEAEAARAQAAAGGTPLERARGAVATLARLLNARAEQGVEKTGG